MIMPPPRSRIRDRPLGQHRSQKMRAWESPDQQDRVPLGEKVPLISTVSRRPGLASQSACASCGRTRDLWEENNGQGLSKGGRRFCCKSCADGQGCTCFARDQEKGQELNSLQRQAARRKR